MGKWLKILQNETSSRFSTSTLLHFYLHQKWKIINCTAKNSVTSPHFLEWKFGGKAWFPPSFGRFAGTMWKLWLSTRFPYQETRWNDGIFLKCWREEIINFLVKFGIYYALHYSKHFEENFVIAKYACFHEIWVLLLRDLNIRHCTKNEDFH